MISIRAAKAKLLSAIHRRLRANGRSLEITKSGWFLIFLTLLVGAVAINSGANLLHLVFGALIGVIVISGVASERMLSRVRVTRTMQSSCFAQQNTPVHLRLDNTHSRYPLIGVRIEMRQETRSTLTQKASLSLVVAPGESQTLATTLQAEQRGYYEAPPLSVATTYPWGFFLKKREIECRTPLYVAPRPGDAQRVQLANTKGNTQEDALDKSRSGEPGEHYPYRPGEDPRSIDYKSSARSPTLLASNRLDQVQASSSFLLPSPSDPALESRLEDLSAAVLEHQDKGVAFSLLQEERVLLTPEQSLRSPELALQLLATHAISTEAGDRT